MGYFPARVQDTGSCTGCAMCAMVCPDAAIEVFTDTKRTGSTPAGTEPQLTKGSK